jgi:PleD family two-component response regulator
VLLAEQALERAAIAGERLRAAVEALDLRHPDGGRVTVSAGVAGLGSHQCSPEQLFALADEALYRAKQAGRNRVETAMGAGQELGEPAVRLLIADDDEAIRLTLSALAERHEALELVGVAADTEEAVALARERRPAVVLLDVTMPGGGGVKAATDLREALPDVRIVVLSAHEGPDVQLDMTRAGAIGYLVKGASDEQIVRAVRSAARW